MTQKTTLLDRDCANGERSGRQVLVWLAVYFTLHIVTRCFVSENLQLDEAEQVVLTQDWLLGYGSQPPLYTWLQKLFFGLFGINVFSLSVLKNLFLYGGYLLLFFGGRELLEDENLAGLTSISLLFSPHIAWESQRDQTHLIMATTVAAATLFAWLKVAKTRRTLWYVIFGIVCGLGLLSKYNFAIVPTALFIAAVMLRITRSAVLDRRIVTALVIMILLVAPHALWAINNPALVSSQSSEFQINSDSGFFVYARIVIRFFLSTGAFVAVPLLIFSPLLIRLRSQWTNRFKLRPLERFLFWLILCGLAFVLCLTLAFHATHLRDRWLQPLLVFTPLLLIALFRREISAQFRSRMLKISTLVGIAILISLNGTVVFANAIGRAHNLNFPHAAFASEIRKARFVNGTIIADGFFLGGNLKKQFQTSRVIVPEHQYSKELKYPIAIVWRSSGMSVPPPSVEACAKKLGIDLKSCTSQYIEVHHKNGSRLSERLGLIVIPQKP